MCLVGYWLVAVLSTHAATKIPKCTSLTIFLFTRLCTRAVTAAECTNCYLHHMCVWCSCSNNQCHQIPISAITAQTQSHSDLPHIPTAAATTTKTKITHHQRKTSLCQLKNRNLKQKPNRNCCLMFCAIYSLCLPPSVHLWINFVCSISFHQLP